MKLYEIIKNNSWLSVQFVLLQLYPDDKKNAVEYERIFNDLQLMEPLFCDISILLNNVHDDFDNSSYVDVSGRHNNPKDNPDEHTDLLGLEFTSWKKWLGMDIDKNALSEFTELEIIAHCLYEMTVISFEEKEIQAELGRLKRTVEEYENMTEEERRKQTTSFDDLLKELDDD